MAKAQKVSGAAKLESTLDARGPGRPPRIDREKILAVAIDIGLMNLTLASVAKRLGVSTQALYRYFPDRENLIEVVTEQLMTRFPLPDSKGEDWCAWAYRFACELYRFYEVLPGMAARAMAKTQTTTGVLIRFETSIKIARDSGFDELTALWATRAVTEFVHTWVAREQMRTEIALASGISYRKSLQAAVDARKHIDLPAFSSALKNSEGISEDSRFEYTLSCLLAGISLHRKGAMDFE